MKICNKCEIEKPKIEFSKNKNKKDGLQLRCKSCNREYVKNNSEDIKRKRKAFYERNSDEILAKNKLYHIKNDEKIKARRKIYYQENFERLSSRHRDYYKNNYARLSEKAKINRAINADKISEYRKEAYKKNNTEILKKRKEYYKANAEAVKARTKEYRTNNQDKVKSRNKEYNRANAERMKKYKKIYIKNKINKDPLFAITVRVRDLISVSIRNKFYTKKSKTYEILGCTFQEFKEHIEIQFTDGMSWENRSEWHLDHYIPIASAKNEEELLRLNHYSNLRPLWAFDNLSKGSKMPF